MITFIADKILAWFSSLSARFITDIGLKWVAYKTLLFTVITVTLPASCKHLLQWLMEGLLSIAGNVPGMNGIESASVQLTGLMGYFASQLMLPDCIAILITACVIRICLNFIPFIG